MTNNPAKRILIIAGPTLAWHGAGKTTFAREFLPNEAECPTFINADLLAAGLNPLQPERAAIQAGRMMLEMIDACVSRGETFRFRNHAERTGLCPNDSALAGTRLLGEVNLPASFVPRSGDSPGSAACTRRRTSRTG